MRKSLCFLLLVSYSLVLRAQNDQPDAAIVAKIRAEGLNNSQVMDIAFHLTDASGPRLMGSPGFLRAANWAKTKLGEWGLAASTLEPWGVFGKGWELQKSYVALTAPYYKPLIAFPKAWCSGTNGLQSAGLMIIEAKDSAGLPALAGKLKGKILLLPRTDTLIPSYKADASRYTDDELSKMAEYKITPPDSNARRGGGRRGLQGAAAFLNSLKEFARKEGALAVFSATTRGFDGTVFVQGGGSYAPGSPENFPDIVLTYEDYMTLYRLAKAGIPVQLDMDIKTRFLTDDTQGYNVVASALRYGAVKKKGCSAPALMYSITLPTRLPAATMPRAISSPYISISTTAAAKYAASILRATNW